MAFTKLLTLAFALFHAAAANRPENTTICDYYTPLVTGKENSPSSQQELMLTITHTFILGNYTQPNVGIPVAGVAAPGKFMGHEVNILAYFTGAYKSTNLGGAHGVVKNFLDDGGAVPLLMSEPANGTESNQYNLLTHVYQYFGVFYGCSKQGGDGFPSYQGRSSMYEVHKYMDTDVYEWGFFVKQIVDAVASLGFEKPDVEFTNTSLYATFGNRCSKPATVIPPDADAELQAICIAGNCPIDKSASCGSYPNGGPVEQPEIANATLLGDVRKENETEAAPTAVWPVHCKRDEGDNCAFASSSASGAASSESGNAAASFAQPVATTVLGCIAWAFAMAATGAATLLVV